MENKKTFKDGISQIVDDIDNRGTTKGDNHISIAELNDLPDVMYSYLPSDESNDDTYYSFSTKTNQKIVVLGLIDIYAFLQTMFVQVIVMMTTTKKIMMIVI